MIYQCLSRSVLVCHEMLKDNETAYYGLSFNRQYMGEGDGSDGGGSVESDCSDSLTELRSKARRGRGSGSDEDDEEEDEDDEEDDDQLLDSFDSYAILSGE